MTATASNIHSLDTPSPPSKPSSPSSPTASFQSQQVSVQRSFINLNPSVRGQSSPFPATPSSATSVLEPPPGIPYLTFIRTWSDAHVARWLGDIKCAQHADTFRDNDIRGDILLELDIPTLKEMGVSSIGDRLRIANAVKTLRQKASSKSSSSSPLSVEQNRPLRLNVNLDAPGLRTNAPESTLQVPSQETPDPSPTSRLASRNGRPPPIQLPPAGRNDLPRIIRDQQPPDSAKSLHGPRPTLSTSSSTPSLSTGIRTPGNLQSSTRPSHPPLPPPPRIDPPAPPPARTPIRNAINGGSQLNGRRTPTQAEAPAYTSHPLPPAPQSSTPSSLHPPTSSSWANTYHLPADPRPGNLGGKPPAIRANTSYLPPRTSSRVNTHGRSGSSGLASPSTSTSNKLANRQLPSNSINHPYAAAQPSLQPPAATALNLSPIAESFQGSSTPSPPTNAYAVGRGPFQPTSNNLNPSLDDLRRYIVKFTLPAEGQSCKVNIADCPGGVEILEKVLRKMNKDGSKSSNFERSTLEGGGLSLDGWSVYMEPEAGEALTESELLMICHAPNHPTRENGLVIRRNHKKRIEDLSLQVPSTGTSRATKRASSISILSGLGVPNPEKALDPPSPTQSLSVNPPYTGKKPSKLRNFFGQRPPSELITTHLTEYFPFTEKKVLERTARNSMMRRNSINKRDSMISWNQQPSSRFSSSTQGSIGRGSSPTRTSISSFVPPPPVPDKTPAAEDIPRVSLSTDDGRSVDLQADEPPSATSPQFLPAIPFPTESLSQSLEDITGEPRTNKPSNASSRLSFMTELRSKRDRSDTASLMTVDQITANVESRRESLAIDRMAIDSNVNSEIDEWTKVDSDDEATGTTLAEEEVEVEVAVAEENEDEEIDSPAEEGEEGEDEDEDEDEIGKTMTSEGNKWIKGALIGSGSFGKVYLGMDASSGLLMAVKQVDLPSGSGPNEERKKSMLSALEREIELLKELRHENIVQYLYSSADDEYLNIFLEYVPGGSVAALLRNYGAFEETLVKNFVRQILQGLHYLHERDIIHRDIKGGNILVDNKGGIKISDFGISKKADSLISGNRAHRPSLQGSVFWMAPEVVKQSGHTNKADIWSVGCLVVEMLTGEHPWAQLTQMQAIFKIGSSAKPTIPSDISAEAQDFLRSTFELNLDDRPAAGELLLHPWVSKKPSKAQALRTAAALAEVTA